MLAKKRGQTLGSTPGINGSLAPTEDLSPEFPTEARRINQRSLAELNAFIDILETGMDLGGETRQNLHTFVI